MMTCKEASRLISEGQERPLGWTERWGLKIHLWICDNCRRFARQMDFLRGAMRKLARQEETLLHGPELSHEAKDRIRRAMLEQDRSQK